MSFLGLDIIDWIGYGASAIVLFSFLMKKMSRLRLINMLGCGLFVVYGILLDWSWPIIVTNFAIFTINFVFLIKEKKSV
ncbi:MAG: YgjV family protein [Vicingaceae bacterium]